MKNWLLACTLGAGAVLPVLAQAEQAQSLEGAISASNLSLADSKLLAEEVKARKPLMELLNHMGGASAMDELGLDISGFYEGSYTYSFSNPPGDAITGRVFDVQHDEYLTNQIDVAVSRTLEATDNPVLGYKNKLNVGFRMEWIYGYDARFIHSNGLFDHHNDDTSRNEEFDLNQAYVQVGLPIGNGLLLTAGKFVTPIGMETINPTTNALYSHSYLFGYAIPFTHTGVTAKYNITDTFSVTAGVVRGWEQSLEDNNDAVSALFSVGYQVNDKVNFILNGITGPEQDDNNGRYRTLLDVILTYAVSDQLSLGFNADWAYDNSNAPGGDDSQWYGAAVYASYKLNDNWTLNARGEWFNDKDSVRGLGTNVYEATIGLAIKPFPGNSLGSNLVFRPEFRYDYAQEGIFDGGGDHHQCTAAADIIFTF